MRVSASRRVDDAVILLLLVVVCANDGARVALAVHRPRAVDRVRIGGWL